MINFIISRVRVHWPLVAVIVMKFLYQLSKIPI